MVSEVVMAYGFAFFCGVCMFLFYILEIIRNKQREEEIHKNVMRALEDLENARTEKASK
jgi:preprotein translocase subunit YajC